MNRLGIETGADLKARSLQFLQERFGKAGAYYYGIARGVDERPVRPDRIRKSIGAETTFAQDIHARDAARLALAPICEKVWRICANARVDARTVTLKVKFADFRQITRARTQATAYGAQAEIEAAALALLDSVFPFEKGIRLLGLSLSSFDRAATAPAQLTLSL